MNYYNSPIQAWLRKQGLPETLFDPDFDAQHYEALERRKWFRARLEELKKEDPEFWGQFRLPNDDEWLVQGRSPMWLKARRDLQHELRANSRPEKREATRLGHRRLAARRKEARERGEF